MTVSVSKPSLNLREELSALKKPSGIKGEELLRANTVADAYTSLNPVMFRNRFINGDMRIYQRNTGAGALAITGNNGAMTVDRFECTVYGSGTGRFSVDQSTSAPAGFTKSLVVTVTTADTSPSAAYAYGVGQTIEGLNVFDLNWGTVNAKPVTISFWVKSSVTGQFPLVINEAQALNNAYGAIYNINAANTWEYKTITVPGPVAGTYPTDNTGSFNVKWGLGGGSSRTIGTGWSTHNQASTQLNVTGCRQLVATNGATLNITGAQLEVGNVATPFEVRPIGTELSLCQRYCEVLYNTSTFTPLPTGQLYNNGDGTLALYCSFPYKVEKRGQPTFSFSSSGSSFFTAYGTSNSSGVIAGLFTGTVTQSTNTGTTNGTFYQNLSGTSGGAAGTAVLLFIKVNQSLVISAEM